MRTGTVHFLCMYLCIVTVRSLGHNATSPRYYITMHSDKRKDKDLLKTEELSQFGPASTAPVIQITQLRCS